LEIGSDAHKELFCWTFLEAHRVYEPEELPWPDLGPEPLRLLRSIPFWDFALQAESDAGPMVHAAARLEAEPLVREALALQAEEEARHARILRHMVEGYGLEVGEVRPAVPRDALAQYVDFGFEECLDSFGAFGLFALARESQLVPEPLFQIFDRVMDEEAQHIVFFVNWFAWREVRRGALPGCLRVPRSLWRYGKALRHLAELLRGGGDGEGEAFTVTGAKSFVENLTPRLVLERSLEENRRRLAHFDDRLLRPRLLPALARAGVALLRVLPRRASAVARDGSPAPGAR
jgi:hypothetical protein